MALSFAYMWFMSMYQMWFSQAAVGGNAGEGEGDVRVLG